MESFSLGLLALHLWGMALMIVVGIQTVRMNPHVRAKAGLAFIFTGYLAGVPVYFTDDATVQVLGVTAFFALFIAGFLLIALAPTMKTMEY